MSQVIVDILTIFPVFYIILGAFYLVNYQANRDIGSKSPEDKWLFLDCPTDWIVLLLCGPAAWAVVLVIFLVCNFQKRFSSELIAGKVNEKYKEK